jgi:hypothetical protein
MGLLDGLMNLSPEQNQGLLAAAAQMLQASGPSRTPVSFGQVLGAGLGGYQQGQQQALERAQQQQLAQLTGLKIKDAESDLKNQDMLRERQRKIQEELLGLGAAGVPTTQFAPAAPQMASAAPGLGPMSPKVGGPDWLQAYQQQQPPAPQPGASLAQPMQRGNLTAATANRLLREAEVYSKHGDFDAANKRYEAATKLMPEVSKIETASRDGNPVRVITFKDGSEQVSEFGAAPDITEISLGDRKLFRDRNTIKSGEAFTMGYSPGDRVSMRGQNMVDARSQDANQIAASGKIVSTSTDLRKEFEGLPEVKNYKQALPAFTAIKDAAARNTTQSDINIVYGLAKLYDPNSVVREGEYATVANSPNIPERIKGYAQYLAGGGRLTPEVKKQILAEAGGRMKSYEDPFVAARDNYTTISKNSGADPALLFPSGYQSPIQQPTAGGKVATLSDIAATAKASGKSTAEVTKRMRELGYTIGGQ